MMKSLMYLAFLLILIVVYLGRLNQKLINYFLIVTIFLITIAGGVYYSNKFLPFSPKKNIFPEHPMLVWLQENAGINRLFGTPTAIVDTNYSTVYSIYGVEGYDALRFKRYAQLIASSESGNIPDNYPRSDALVSLAPNNQNERLLDILGVKYLVDKDDSRTKKDESNRLNFENEKIKLVWQEGIFKIYERKTALPRMFLSSDYKIINNNKEIINHIYDTEFDFRTILLEEQPSLSINDDLAEITVPEVIDYQANNLEISTKENVNSLLFISDSYDENWSAYINGEKTKILRANYSFRALPVPAGNNIINMKYEPVSFKVGITITFITLIALIIYSVISVRYKKI